MAYRKGQCVSGSGEAKLRTVNNTYCHVPLVLNVPLVPLVPLVLNVPLVPNVLHVPRYVRYEVVRASLTLIRHPMHRYTLQPYQGTNSRYHCPACNHSGKTFSRYIDTETNQHLHATVGRCSREVNCGYHYKPGQYFKDNDITTPPQLYTPPIVPERPTSYIPAHIFTASQKWYTTNHLLQYLCRLFGAVVAGRLADSYHIGTAKHWPGATVFWQVDVQGQVRTGKIMLYNPATGRRVKEPYNHITWAHTLLQLPHYQLQQCLFGEHLLAHSNKPVAITESEKTAMIASVFMPRFTWLAAGSISNLTAARCSILKGRRVILFPDLNAYDKWAAKAHELSHITHFTIADTLERHATDEDRLKGLDIGDYLVEESKRY